jgi:catechol 2,3-dioxygenase-like lactoylglutathione lyase family enzyme
MREQEEPMNEDIKTPIVGIVTVGLPVSDQDRALEFYVGTLGLEKRRDVPFAEGKRWVDVAPPGSETTIALAAAGTPTGIRLATNDVDAKHAELCAHDVEAGEVLRWESAPTMFAFRDPDGNGLEIIEQA